MRAPGDLARLRSRIIDSARREASPTRRQVTALHRLVGAVALLVPLAIFWGAGAVRSAPRPDALVLETVLGSAAVASVIAVVGVGRGKSMLGRPRAHLLCAALAAPVLLLGWRILVGAQHPHLLLEWPERPGLRCLVLSALLSMAPLGGLFWVRRGSDPVHPRAGGAALAASAGAGAWVLVDLWCPVSYVPHLLLGHVLPMAFLIAAGALVGRRILGVPRE